MALECLAINDPHTAKSAFKEILFESKVFQLAYMLKLNASVGHFFLIYEGILSHFVGQILLRLSSRKFVLLVAWQRPS